MLVTRLWPKFACLQPCCSASQMSRWARRGQCAGRVARSSSQSRHSSPIYRPVSRQWQERQCRKLRLPFVRTPALARPRPPPSLRTQEPYMVHETSGDGNCLFRCLSLVITGSERHHNLVRQRIVSHISHNCRAFSALLPESPAGGNGHADACAQYLSKSKMAAGSTWGSDVEILAAAHLLRTRIFVYTMHGPDWQWVEHGLELTDPGRKPYKESIYLMHTGLVHYDLVETVCECHAEGEPKSTPPSSPTDVQPQGVRKPHVTPARSRRHSVPCPRRVPHCGAGYRTRGDRSSSSGSSSSSSSSGIDSHCSVSSESCSSCRESVGSSDSCSTTREARNTKSHRRNRLRYLPSDTHNNNCVSKKQKGNGSLRKSMPPFVMSEHNVNRSCSKSTPQSVTTKCHGYACKLQESNSSTTKRKSVSRKAGCAIKHPRLKSQRLRLTAHTLAPSAIPVLDKPRSCRRGRQRSSMRQRHNTTTSLCTLSSRLRSVSVHTTGSKDKKG